MVVTLKKYASSIYIFLIGILFIGCTEPFAPELPVSDSVLVVEARITDELKNHEVVLTRSVTDEDAPEVESNATVSVIDDTNQTYTYSETNPGTYISDIVFAAETNKQYRLKISTSNGRSYTSSEVKLTQASQIEIVEAKKTTTNSGVDGVTIDIGSFDPTGNSTYYKYEYEETYKIIAPNWGPEELVVLSEEAMAVGLQTRQNEEQTCYATKKSKEIILTKTSGASEDRVTNFSVRFLNDDNFIISHRYSILVKQYILSREAYTFYEKLQEFSGSEGLFSQSQPGFVNGNIAPEDGSGERVVGFFNASSVSEKRAFFNYTDFYADTPLPPFVDECRRTNFNADGDPTSVFVFVKENAVSLAGTVSDPFTGQLQEYIVVPRVCGDCTVLGSATVPEFWEE